MSRFVRIFNERGFFFRNVQQPGDPVPRLGFRGIWDRETPRSLICPQLHRKLISRWNHSIGLFARVHDMGMRDRAPANFLYQNFWSFGLMRSTTLKPNIGNTQITVGRKMAKPFWVKFKFLRKSEKFCTVSCAITVEVNFWQLCLR